MLFRQHRFTLLIAILFSCGTLVGISADWIRGIPFDIDIFQQSFILFCAGLTFLLWDYHFFLRSAKDKSYEYYLFSYLISGSIGFVFLAMTRIVPILFSENVWGLLSNIFTIIGIFLLLITVFLRFSNSHRQNRKWEILWFTGLCLLVFMFSRGLFTYLLLCLISTFSGRGLLRLVGIPELNKKSLAPFASLVFWSIFLGFFVGLGIPIKYLSLVVWPLTIFLIWWGKDKKNINQSFNAGDLFIIGIPLLLVYKYTLHGFFQYPGSSNMDHWNYVAVGQYLWDFSRCAQGVQIPIYKFANNFACNFRYISPSLLSFFSGLLNRVGDAQPTAGIFLPWGMFVYCSSLTFMIENITKNKQIRMAYLFFGALAGWPMMLVIASNFDNLLILPYLPVIFSISLRIKFSWRWNITLGFLLASIGYTYPEMSPFIYLATGIFILKRIVLVKIPLSKIVFSFIIIGTSALVAVMPYLSTAVLFFKRQLISVSDINQILPGQGFWPELISPTYKWIAFWGMGGKIYNEGFYIYRTVISIALFTILGYGCYILIKTKEWALFSLILIFSGATIYLNFYLGYAYGTYKLFVLFWWLIAFVVILAYKNIANLYPQSQKMIYFAGISLYFAYIISVVILAVHVVVLPFNSIQPFKQLESLPIPPNKSIAAIITDDYNNIWAAYYLRNEEIFIFPLGGYMTGSINPFDPSVKQANFNDTEYLLSDSRKSNLPGKIIWQNSRYSLLELPSSWAYAFDIKNPNGSEMINEKPFFWLGNDFAEIQIVSSFDGCSQITFFPIFGPSLPEETIRHLFISSDKETTSLKIANDKLIKFTVNLKNGVDNIIRMKVLDEPTLFIQPNGDRRILLLGILDFSVVKCY